jgi:carbonic anhydrase
MRFSKPTKFTREPTSCGNLRRDRCANSRFLPVWTPVSHYLLDTREIMVINHTDCGLMQTTEKDLRAKIEKHTGVTSDSPKLFFAFENVDENVRQQIQKLHAHPWTSEEFPARGFVYDVSTGRLREVK